MFRFLYAKEPQLWENPSDFNSANGKSKLLVPLLVAFVVAELNIISGEDFVTKIEAVYNFMIEVNFEGNSNMDNHPQIEWLHKHTC